MVSGKNWNDVFSEIESEGRSQSAPHQIVRSRYLKEFHGKTGRNVICYYSGWLQKTGNQFSNVVSINDEDKNGFMACFHKMDFSKGLDLFIHSPGGSVAATESIIHYIRKKFKDDIRVFVPQIAMSGGTMIAFCAKEIWMGHHSNLGPIDPQYGSQPASLLISEFDRIVEDVRVNPYKIDIWRPILEQISPTLISECENAIAWSKSIGINALASGMFKNKVNAKAISKNIIDYFSSADEHKNHGRHIHFDDCHKIGLNCQKFEDNQDLQDTILKIHHSFMITLMNTDALKIIQNHLDVAQIINLNLKQNMDFKRSIA